MEQQASEARERTASLRTEASSTMQQGGIVKALMEAMTSGEVSGVYGRLGKGHRRMGWRNQRMTCVTVVHRPTSPPLSLAIPLGIYT